MGFITTLRDTMQVVYGTNVSASSITNPAPTATEPTSGICGPLRDADTANQYFVQFFGAGADNATGVALLVKWRRARQANGSFMWVPTPLVGLDLTLSTAVGIADMKPSDSERFADTIALKSGQGYFSDGYRIISNGANMPAAVVVDVLGGDKLQVLLGTGGSATSLNALSAKL